MNPYLNQAMQMVARLKSHGKPCAIGYPHLTEQNYHDTVSTFADCDQWPKSFSEYKSRADQQLEAFALAGLTPIAVELDGEEFTAFRQANGFTDIDSQSRNAFCSYKVTEWAE